MSQAQLPRTALRLVARATGLMLRECVRWSMAGMPRGPHITRYYMYRHLATFKQSPAATAKVLSISHSAELCKILGLTDIELTEANYPEFNILSLPFADDSFDYVLSDQVLEHVEGEPQRAMDETFRVLRRGGIALHTTCFLYPVHKVPNDFWRFTPEALALLCQRFSEVIEAGGWGNPYISIVEALGLRYEAVPERRWHPLHQLAVANDAEWPIVTWVIARK